MIRPPPRDRATGPVSAAPDPARAPVWAVVPVRSLREGKTRLAEHLEPAEREALNRRLLERTLAAVLAVEQLAGVLVISPDRGVLALAQSRGAAVLPESEPRGLNGALEQARHWAVEHGARSLISIFADLPWLSPDDLQALLDAGRENAQGPVLVLAPDRDGEGTNAILQSPPGTLVFQHGPSSFAKHCAQAREIGVEPRVVRRPGLLFDIDSPDDLARWRASDQPAGHGDAPPAAPRRTASCG